MKSLQKNSRNANKILKIPFENKYLEPHQLKLYLLLCRKSNKNSTNKKESDDRKFNYEFRPRHKNRNRSEHFLFTKLQQWR